MWWNYRDNVDRRRPSLCFVLYRGFHDVFSVLRDSFFFLFCILITVHSLHCRLWVTSWTWLSLLFPFQFSIRKKHISGVDHRKKRPVTQLDKIRFVEIWFVVLRVRILIIEFWSDVLIIHSLYSSIEFWYRSRVWQHMERDNRTLWKWDDREIRHVLCLRRNVLDHIHVSDLTTVVVFYN